MKLTMFESLSSSSSWGSSFFLDPQINRLILWSENDSFDQLVIISVDQVPVSLPNGLQNWE